MQWLLLKLQWKKFFRAPGVERELFQKILVSAIAIFIFSRIIVVAFHIPELLQDMSRQLNTGPVKLVNALLLIYFIGELFSRFVIQSNSIPDLRPLLLEPIRKRKLGNIVLFWSIFHPLNLVALLLFGPFTFRVLLPQYGSAAAWAWYCGVVLISWSFHFLILIFRQRLMEKLWVWGIILGLAALGYWLQYSTGFEVLTPFQKAFEILLTKPVFIMVPLLFFLSMLFLAQHYTIASLYEEVSKKNIRKSRYTFHFLDRGNESRAFYQQELRLIFRNKRTRSSAIIAFLFLGYGFIFFSNPSGNHFKAIYLFAGIFISGIFIINYGQFLWSWLTNTVTFFFLQPVTMQRWVNARYNFLVGSCVIFTLLSTPYAYFGLDQLLAVLAGGLYNIGVNIPLIMRISLWEPKPIDLSRSPMMNYQGAGAAQWLMGIPVVLGPLLVYAPFGYFGGYRVGIIALGMIGLVGYFLHSFFLQKITASVSEKRYYLINKLKI